MKARIITTIVSILLMVSVKVAAQAVPVTIELSPYGGTNVTGMLLTLTVDGEVIGSVDASGSAEGAVTTMIPADDVALTHSVVVSVSYKGGLVDGNPAFGQFYLDYFGTYFLWTNPYEPGFTTPYQTTFYGEFDYRGSSSAKPDLTPYDFTVYNEVITSPITASGVIGQKFTSYQITTNFHPASYSVAGLPDGLTLDASSGLISGAPTEAGTFPVNLQATDANGYYAFTTLTLTISSVKLAMLRADDDAVANGSDQGSQGVDVPLVLNPDLVALGEGAPISGGLVADGVTPLLFSITPSIGPNSPTNYTISFDSVTGGSIFPQTLLQHLRVLNNGAFSSGSQVTISSSDLTYAYLTGFNPEELGINPGNHGITARLVVQPTGVSGAMSTLTFGIRRPPIVLVHGFNTPGGIASWNGNNFKFLNVLYADRGADFVDPITYADESHNTLDRFDTLVLDLDQTLSASGGPEDRTSDGLFKDWAITRYDLVCHSQGGVLSRMLCTDFISTGTGVGTPFGNTAFRSFNNYYRGRFRRVITIGSPHNGCLLLHYMLQCRARSLNPFFRWALPYALGQSLQPKFDPFGQQVQEINSPTLVVDPGAKFNLIATEIFGGQPPSAISPSVPLSYRLEGLTGVNLIPLAARGAVVLPHGSDGVVEPTSSEGGSGSRITLFANYDDAHSGPLKIFETPAEILGLAPANTDTANPDIATTVLRLLDDADNATGPSAFGPFVLPTLLTSAEQQAIDAVVPSSFLYDMIAPSASMQAVRQQPRALAHTRAKQQTSGAASSIATTYTYSLTPTATEPPQNGIDWYAETYGAGGVSSDGVTVQVDTSDSTRVTVTVDSTVQGDVVLRASYNSTTGDLVFAKPIIVVSTPAGSAGATVNSIEIDPSTVTVATDERVDFTVNEVYTDGTIQPLFISSDTPIQFTSSDPDILSVSPDGSATGVGVGTATVTASFGKFTAQAAFQVISSGLPNVTVVTAGDGMAIEGGEKGKVFVMRTGDLSAPLTVLYKAKGTAVPGVDYKTLPGSVTIPAGASKAKVKVKPLDSHFTGTRKVKLKLLPATDNSYSVGTPSLARIKVIDE